MKKTLSPKRARRADKRSLELFQSRARAIAQAELEDVIVQERAGVRWGASSCAGQQRTDGNERSGIEEGLLLPPSSTVVSVVAGSVRTNAFHGEHGAPTPGEPWRQVHSESASVSNMKTGITPGPLLRQQAAIAFDTSPIGGRVDPRKPTINTLSSFHSLGDESESHLVSEEFANDGAATSAGLGRALGTKGMMATGGPALEVSRPPITPPRELQTRDEVAAAAAKLDAVEPKVLSLTLGRSAQGNGIDDARSDYERLCADDRTADPVFGDSQGVPAMGCFESEEEEDKGGKQGGRNATARTTTGSRRRRDAFVVVGLTGEFNERVLLLPTSARRSETVGDRPAESEAETVFLRWGSGEERQQLRLSRVKSKKPSAPNPLPALATVLSWMRELGEDIVPGVRLPVLPPLEDFGPTAWSNPRNGDVANLEHEDFRACGDRLLGEAWSAFPQRESPNRYPPRERPASARLSVGAAWMLGHLVFGQGARHVGVGSCLPVSVVGERGGGATRALSLLSCPDIAWAPDPREVTQALTRRRAGAGGGAGGSMTAYVAEMGSISSSISSIGRRSGENGVDRVAHDGELEMLRVTACRELVEAGLCDWVEEGGGCARKGGARLRREVALSFEICLRIFNGHRAVERDTLAAIALGAVQTGPMMTMRMPMRMPMGLPKEMLPPPVRSSAFIEAHEGSTSICQPSAAGAGGVGRMKSPVGLLCVRLTAWCIEISREVGAVDHAKNLLWQIIKPEVAGDKDLARAWTGPMGEALGLLGGGRLEGKAGDHKADDGPSGGCSWMASMSKEQRLRDVVCLRLKQAVERVVDLLSCVVAGWQTERRYEDAILLLQLLVRRDQGLAGDRFREAPDLLWAADWCTCRFRGWAWVRLSLNLEKIGEFVESLEALRSASEDLHVKGGELLEVRDRLASRYCKYGNPEDTPPGLPLPPEYEEQIVVDMDVGKEGNRRHKQGGRLLFFDRRPTCREGRNDRENKKGVVVEAVALRAKRDSGGWLGLHCESRVITFLLMLLLWEEMFQADEEAAYDHCFTDRPLDLMDLHFCARRRPGLQARLDAVARATDEELWKDVGNRFERFEGVKCVWCSWRDFTKQQAMEIAAAFGGRRLSYIFKALTRDLPHMYCGFPDLVLWRPKGRTGNGIHSQRAIGRQPEEFGLDWEADGHGWEVEVVEVKSVKDTLSYVQRAWLTVLRNAGVPAKVLRVFVKGGPRGGGKAGR